jgi:hypothetical protein
MASLKCYLSVSNLVDTERVDQVSNFLAPKNIQVSFHKRGKNYDESKLVNSDFVLFIPWAKTVSKDRSQSKKTFENVVGKGQFGEATHCCMLNKPAFVFQGFDDDGQLLMTKLYEEDHEHLAIMEDWKKRWGWIRSYVRGNGPVPLIQFLEGFFGWYSPVPEQLDLFDKNKRFLLLL